MEAIVTREFAIKRIKEVALSESYHRGDSMTFSHVAARLPMEWPARLIAEGCELAGFPVWSSVPDDALQA